jgi:separase
MFNSSNTYCEALGLSVNLSGEEKGMTIAQRVKARAGSLERAAIAAHTYGVIQYAKVHYSLSSAILSRLSDIFPG